MEGLFIIVAIYVVLSVLGAMQKKARQEQQRRAGGTVAGTPARQAAGATALQRALRELERAEAEAVAKRRGRVPELDGRTPITFPLPRQRRIEPAPLDYDDEAVGDTDEGEEEVLPVEAISLDDESAREVEARERAYETVAPQRAYVSERPEAKPAAVGPSITSAIVPAVSVGEEPAAPMTSRRRAAGRRVDVRRLLTTNARTAIVLAEILGRPVGERY